MASFENEDSNRLSDKEFENLVNKNFPSWNAVWNLLLETNREKKRTASGVRAKNPEMNSNNLQKRICHKITELVSEEEVLAGLYEKAADAAKEREEELRGKSAVLMKQIEKDKNFMRTLETLS